MFIFKFSYQRVCINGYFITIFNITADVQISKFLKIITFLVIWQLFHSTEETNRRNQDTIISWLTARLASTFIRHNLIPFYFTVQSSTRRRDNRIMQMMRNMLSKQLRNPQPSHKLLVEVTYLLFGWINMC